MLTLRTGQPHVHSAVPLFGERFRCLSRQQLLSASLNSLYAWWLPKHSRQETPTTDNCRHMVRTIMVRLLGSDVSAVCSALMMISQTLIHNLITTRLGFRVLLMSTTTLYLRIHPKSNVKPGLVDSDTGAGVVRTALKRVKECDLGSGIRRDRTW